MFSSLSSLLLVAQASATIFYAGVAESGGEFGVFSANATVGTGLPGRFGVDFDFINEATVDTFVDQDGINLFRVAFLLERMCPLSFGLGSKFNETHFAEYKSAIDYITVTKGAYAIFDPHNYMRYNNPSQQPDSGSIIGDVTDPAAATTEQFEEFWKELAGRFVDNEKVIFGIMNEVRFLHHLCFPFLRAPLHFPYPLTTLYYPSPLRSIPNNPPLISPSPMT